MPCRRFAASMCRSVVALLLPLAACSAGSDPPEPVRPGTNTGGAAATNAVGGAAAVSAVGGTAGGVIAGGTGGGPSAGGASGTGGAGGVVTGGTGGGGPGGTGGAAGNQLFADDFESPEYTLDEWFPNSVATDWTIVPEVSNVYQQGAMSNVLRISSAGDAGWTDQAIEVRVKPLAFGGQGTSYLVGVYARVRSVDDFYYVALREDGRIAIRSKVAGENTTLGSAVDAGIVPNTWYTVKLEVIGATINAYLDGALLVTASDSNIAMGAVGLGTTNATAQFDDVRVTLP